MIDTLSDAEVMALTAAVSNAEGKEAKQNMTEGEHNIDLFVRIFGKLTKKVSDKAATTSIPWLKSLAIALHKSGIQRENILFAIEEAIKISMVMGQDEIAEMIGMNYEDIDNLVSRIKKEVVANIPKTTVIRVNPKLIINRLCLEDSDEVVSTDLFTVMKKTA